MRVGHGGEIAVVGGAHPACARCVGTILAGRAAAGERTGRRGRGIGIEACALGREAFAVEGRIAVRARADPVTGEGLLMGIGKCHALTIGIATQRTALAQGERLDFRQELP